MLPPPPKKRTYSNSIFSKGGTLGMMLNDSLGDCTCAAAGHMVET